MSAKEMKNLLKFAAKGRPKVDPSPASVLVRAVRTESRFNFTKKLLDQLRLPATGRAYYNDTQQRGLQLKVYPTGRKTFCLYRKVDGRPDRITIGPYPDFTIEQARRRAQELAGAIARGQNPARERASIRDEMTFAELFEVYLEKHARAHKRTWKNDVSIFNLHLDCLRERKLSSITKSELVALHVRIGKRASYAANRTMELVGSMFNRAREWGWTGENPAAGIKAFKEHKRRRFLDADELPSFFQSLADEQNLTIRDFILAALLTGARRSNVQSMRWDEIVWQRAVWEIPAEKSKSGEAMDVALVPPMLDLLARRQAESTSEWVFPVSNQSGHLVAVKNQWRRILKRAGIADCRLHDLRRTLASWQALEGASLVIIGASLGHKSLQATQVYARLSSSPVHASVARAADAMIEAGHLPKGLLPAPRSNGNG